MPSPDRLERARAAADHAFEAASNEADLLRALAEHADAEDEFIERLAVRTALASVSEAEKPDLDMNEQIADAIARYASMPDPDVADLSQPATWTAANDKLGGDMAFVIKLFDRKVSTPTRRFLQDAADALGASLAAIKLHFASVPAVGPAGVERKASGAQRGLAQEDFASAVSAANISEDLKRRWLES
jgi:hypothetical protein